MPTLSELQAIVRRDESLNSTTVISDANLIILLNEGALELNRLGHALPLSGTWSAVADAQTYVLSGTSPKLTRFLEIDMEKGLIYTQESGSTKTAPNDFTWVTEEWLDLHLPGWQDSDSSDSLQYVYLTHESDGSLSLGVYPKSATTTPTFKLYFLQRGTDMSAAGHYPWTGSTTNLGHLEAFQKGIAWYAMGKLHREKTFTIPLADYYDNEFLKIAARMKDAQNRARMMESEGLRRKAYQESSQTFGRG